MGLGSPGGSGSQGVSGGPAGSGSRAGSGGDDEGEVSRSQSGPPTKWQRQVVLPELQFSSFRVFFRVLGSN